jgi:hypothetical protein
MADGAFWRSASHGIAAFYAEDQVFAFRVEMPVAERVCVADRFLIRPLLPSVQSRDHYFVLALSQKRVRVFEGVRTDLVELEPTGVPSGLAEVLRFDDYERHIQFHSRTPASASGKGRRPAIFHGHGGIPDVARDNLIRYFRNVDRGMRELLRDETAPLLLAGVDYLLPLYREVNSYPHLAEEGLHGNPDESSAHELGEAVYDKVEPLLRSNLERDLDALRGARGTDSVSTDLREIVPAALEGRVRVLFVTPERSDWGAFDPSSGRVDLHDDQQPGDWDLTDLAAAETLLHGGIVHAVDDEPTASAIFRY